MTETLQHNGYDGSILFDPEENRFHGRILGIKDFILYDASTKPELEICFQGAVEEYLRFCHEDEKQPEIPFATLAVHVSPEVHRRVSLLAERHEMALNSIVERALSEYLAHAE